MRRWLAPIVLALPLAAVIGCAGTGSAPTPTATSSLTATPTPSPFVSDSCDAFRTVSASVGELLVPLTVSSYQCGPLHVDSTGQSAQPGALRAAAGDVLKLHFDAPLIPTLVEARLYEGDGVAAWFFRWPEDLPNGTEAALSVTTAPSPDPHLALDAAPGSYSLVVHAVWDVEAESFFALGVTILG